MNKVSEWRERVKERFERNAHVINELVKNEELSIEKITLSLCNHLS